MINGTATAISSYQSNVFLFSHMNVTLEPGILVTTEHYARIVSPKEQYVVFREVEVAIQPVLQRQIDRHVRGLRDEYRLLDRIDVLVRGISRCMSDDSPDAIETGHAPSGENQSDG